MGKLADETRAILQRRYPKFDQFPAGERVLLVVSVLANDLKVREKGRNGGSQVKEILATTGLGEGFAWCAALIKFAAQIAEVGWGPTGVDGARVWKWHALAAQENRLRTAPKRGYLCLWLNENKTGHIGIVASVSKNGRVTSYEGNTSSGDSGSQRDGDGAYRRVRAASIWEHYIEFKD